MVRERVVVNSPGGFVCCFWSYGVSWGSEEEMEKEELTENGDSQS